MTTENLQERLLEFIRPSYPDIQIKVIDEADKKRHIYFIEHKFSILYPQQRYHYLIHRIPQDFFEDYLTETVWHELAPGETSDDLDYHDTETIESIKEVIFKILKEKTDFVGQLDSLFISQKVFCHGDFRHSKQILTDLKFTTEEQFDIFHVLMHEGGYCDCEILYNTFKDTGYAKKYWMERKNNHL